MQAARRVFAFFPVRDVYGYWLWLEVIDYNPKTGDYRRCRPNLATDTQKQVK